MTRMDSPVTTTKAGTSMATNAEVASRFVRRGRDLKSLSMFTEDSGQRLYSYGHHYLLAEHTEPGRVLVNEKKYSQTTSRHRSEVVQELAREGYRQTGFTTEGNLRSVWQKGE
jgi:Fe-S cluster biosynthesis and repair protein YggX